MAPCEKGGWGLWHNIQPTCHDRRTPPLKLELQDWHDFLLHTASLAVGSLCLSTQVGSSDAALSPPEGRWPRGWG